MFLPILAEFWLLESLLAISLESKDGDFFI